MSERVPEDERARNQPRRQSGTGAAGFERVPEDERARNQPRRQSGTGAAGFEPRVVCILGMHRSGTSLVARMLHVLGLDLGPEQHLMGPSADNPTGHWESVPIKEINDEILERLGGSWSEPPELAAGWERSPELAGLRRRARELIEADFSGSDRWGFKDPRNSLTLPFWQRILPPMHYVICLRNPLDVAASLAAREEDSVPFERGIDLWLTYVRAALAATAGRPQQLLFYEDLMVDPGPLVGEFARVLGHDPDAAGPEARAAIRVAMSEGLWHHRTTVPNAVDATRLAFHVKALYLALRQFVPGPEPVGTPVLDLLATYAADAGHRLASLEADRSELAKARERSGALERRRVSLERRLSQRRADLERTAKARAEEQRIREQLEAEVEASQADGRRIREELEAELEASQADGRKLREELEAARGELSQLRSAARNVAADAEEAFAPAAMPSGTDDRLVREIRARAQELIPSGATVLVAAKGEDALLDLDDRRTLHFPCGADGRYAGYHPAGDTAAIAHLEALHARGADHLLLSASTLWWLDHYQGLRRHLEERYVPLLQDERCAIYRLDSEGRRHAAGPITTLRSAVASLRTRSGQDPSVLDWHTELAIAHQLPEMPVFVPPDDGSGLPYLDGTIDIIVLGSEDPARMAEARRVAADAVITFRPASPERSELEWLANDPGGWGEDVSVILIPDTAGSDWNPTVGAVTETLTDGFTGELILVGDRATLGSAEGRAQATGSRLRSIEVAPKAGFGERARAAIEAVERRIHVFVAAPAVPLPDWLPSIVALLSPERDSGVVGTRILSGDGTLKEAGGVLAPGGSRLRHGEGDPDPDRPEYCFVRRVDFCSPPLLATRRDLFERLGGLPDGPVPPDDALVEFSLRAGRAGAPVYYQPRARVVAIGNGEP